MIDDKDIDHLAKLARMELAAAEKKSLKKDLSGILNYVSDLKSAPAGEKIDQTPATAKNIIRSDDYPHESSAFSKKLLDLAPQTKNNFIKVKKILG